MGNFVIPKAFIIAETKIDSEGMFGALQYLGASDWRSDTHNDAQLLTEFAGKLCYMSFDTSLNANLTKVNGRDNHDYIQQGIIGNHHGSVLEHSTVTFLFADVSRVVTHELVRHRVGTAFSQTSGRYVRSDEVNMYMPRCIEENETARTIFQEAMYAMEADIAALEQCTEVDKQNFAKKKELTSAFRRLVGFGHSSNITMTANHRTWRHLIELRTDPGAEEEIRVLFAEVSKQLRARYPAIYADARIEVVDGIEWTLFEHSKV